MQTRTIVPLIVSSALFMQQLDATALATSLPSMGLSLGVPPLRLHLAITSYLLSLAIFLPVSGWVADRFGPRQVFRAAIAIFMLGSIFCGTAFSLDGLICARIVQGLGGAMMVPVGRLILVRSVEKSELVSAMALMSMTAIAGPAAGPLLGGVITTFYSWRWIFWINVPAGLLGIFFTTLFVKDVVISESRTFDYRGFVMTGVGFGCLMFGIDLMSSTENSSPWPTMMILIGVAALTGYFYHANLSKSPILDLQLFKLPTFRISITGGSIFRIGFGALPFLLPLLMQEGLGYSPLQSGTITFVSAIGSFGMRTMVRRILKIFGFRHVLVWNSLISNFFVACCGLFDHATPRIVMMLILFFGGVFRALEFTSINAIAFADVTYLQMGDATSMTQMSQRISQSLGVALAASVLEEFGGNTNHFPIDAFSVAFLVMAVASSLSVLFFLQLPQQAGAEIANRGGGSAPSSF